MTLSRLTLFAAALTVLAATGCEKHEDTPAERAADAIEDGADAARDAADDAADAVRDAGEDHDH